MADKLKSLLGGGGFYAVLALCVLAAGVGGYFLLLRQPAEDPSAQEEVLSPVEDMPEHTPVVEAVEPEVPEEEAPVPMPEEVVLDDTPVMAEEPHLVVSPLQGEVVTAFSMDQLIYSETMDDWRTHDGMDISAEAGTAVLAA